MAKKKPVIHDLPCDHVQWRELEDESASFYICPATRKFRLNDYLVLRDWTYVGIGELRELKIHYRDYKSFAITHIIDRHPALVPGFIILGIVPLCPKEERELMIMPRSVS